MACGDLSRENYHYIIQESVVIMAHGGETWFEQIGGGGRMGGFNEDPLKNSLMSVSVVVNVGEDY